PLKPKDPPPISTTSRDAYALSMLRQYNLRRLAIWALIATAFLLVLATSVLALEEGWGLSRAFVAVLAFFGKGGGPGIADVSLGTHYLIVATGYAGILMTAILMAAIVDFVLRVRLPMLYVQKGKHMRNHIILSGLSRVGYRTLLELKRLGQEVIVIESSETSQFVQPVTEQHIPIVFGALRDPRHLTEAGIDRAQAVICAADEDLVNLEVALNAREMQPDIRIVIRLFDEGLASKIAHSFDIQVAFSSSALAAPAFATAAVAGAVRGSFQVRGRPYVSGKVEVLPGSPLVGQTLLDLRDKYSITTVMVASEDGSENWTPGVEDLVRPNSVLYLVGPFDELQSVERDSEAVQDAVAS
ncbi:MAG: potassium channel family protein, partial [Acidimicrobiia bacterium]